VGYGLYRAANGRSETVKLITAGVAAWLSVMAAALMTSLELWLSGTVALGIVVPAMLGVHAFIGLGEALITVAALAFIFRVRPDLLGDSEAKGSRVWIVGGALLTLAVVLLAPFASASPDGLERVAEDVGFLGTAVAAPYEVLPDYTIPFIGSENLSTIIAGAVGVIIVAALALYLVRLTRRSAPRS